VSDGEINATIPKGVDPMQIVMEEAVDLLKERAAKGGGRRPARGGARARGGRKAPSKAPRRSSRKGRKEPAPEGS
jgi:DNA topoisomerase-1